VNAVAISEQQEPLDGFATARLKVVGVGIDEIAEPPNIDDVMTLLVRVVCTGRGVKRMKDGELRREATMSVLEMEVKEGPTKPTGAPDLFSVNDDDD
jgi:hypothetical protein